MSAFIVLEILKPLAAHIAPGLLGTGAMDRLPNESIFEYERRLEYGAGAAVMAFNGSMKQKQNYPDTKTAIKAGAINQFIINLMPWVFALFTMVTGVTLIINKSKK